jgi:hypothetical protein
VIQNVRTTAATLSLGTFGGVSLIAGTNPVSIASNASVTWTFQVAADIPVGGTVFWQYSIAGFTYNSRITLNEAGCTPVSRCVSDRFNVIGTTCPTTALVAARTAQPPRDFR